MNARRRASVTLTAGCGRRLPTMTGNTRGVIVVGALAAVLASPVAATQPAEPQLAAGIWQIDAGRSETRFTVTKLGHEDVTGVFRESEGEIRFDPARIESSSIQWRVRVASVKTDASNRDRTLQSAEYFDARNQPYLSFVSRAVRAGAGGLIEVAGDITIRGVTRPLTISVRPRATAAGPAFATDFEINRYDFGVAGGSFFGRLIGSRVRVHLLAATTPVPTATVAR
jgi:polyisoprenoid-binding protein YceI